MNVEKQEPNWNRLKYLPIEQVLQHFVGLVGKIKKNASDQQHECEGKFLVKEFGTMSTYYSSLFKNLVSGMEDFQTFQQVINPLREEFESILALIEKEKASNILNRIFFEHITKLIQKKIESLNHLAEFAKCNTCFLKSAITNLESFEIFWTKTMERIDFPSETETLLTEYDPDLICEIQNSTSNLKSRLEHLAEKLKPNENRKQLQLAQMLGSVLAGEKKHEFWMVSYNYVQENHELFTSF